MSKDKGLMDILTTDNDKNGVADWIDKLVAYAPYILLVAANLAILFGIWRVYDVVYVMTGKDWQAIGAAAAVGVPFVLWELAWQYRNASPFQRLLAIVAMVVDLVAATAIGVADYLFSYFTVNGGTLNAPYLLGAVVVLLTVHVIGWLLYFYNDPLISADRTTKMYAQRKERMNRAEDILKDAEKLLATKRRLEEQFGREAAQTVIDKLDGRKPRRVVNENNAPRDYPRVEKQMAMAEDVDAVAEVRDSRPLPRR